MLVTSSTFAATTTNTITPSKKTIILNNRTYTLNVCNAKEVDALRLKVIVWLKGKTLAQKKRIYTQLRLLQAAWMKSCPSNPTTTVVTTPDSNFTVVTNPTFISNLPTTQKNTATERAKTYANATEGIIDSMISQWILSSSDKAIIKGNVELNYVNDCKKIDWITTVKQWFDGNKKRVKNELVSISLNVSVCEERNFNILFDTSYKHVLIHELWHYIYYLKDNNTPLFEDICRDAEWNRKTSCAWENAYYSKYAMNDPQEDYAESFSYRYESKKPDSSSVNISIIKEKTQHFTNLFGK